MIIREPKRCTTPENVDRAKPEDACPKESGVQSEKGDTKLALSDRETQQQSREQAPQDIVQARLEDACSEESEARYRLEYAETQLKTNVQAPKDIAQYRP